MVICDVLSNMAFILFPLAALNSYYYYYQIKYHAPKGSTIRTAIIYCRPTLCLGNTMFIQTNDVNDYCAAVFISKPCSHVTKFSQLPIFLPISYCIKV